MANTRMEMPDCHADFCLGKTDLGSQLPGSFTCSGSVTLACGTLPTCCTRNMYRRQFYGILRYPEHCLFPAAVQRITRAHRPLLCVLGLHTMALPWLSCPGSSTFCMLVAGWTPLLYTLSVNIHLSALTHWAPPALARSCFPYRTKIRGTIRGWTQVERK